MLLLGSNLVDCPVLSLHVGGEIARVTEPIIDPENLKIIAFRVVGPLTEKETGNILMTDDVREFSSIGMIVDSGDSFVNAGEIVRLDKVLEFDFDVVGLKVVTKKGTKLGKVINYMINPGNFEIQQIVVQRPFFKALNDPELWIGRSEIVEINDYEIVVKDEEAKIKQKIAKDFTPDFVNPFKKQTVAPAHTKNLDEADTE